MTEPHSAHTGADLSTADAIVELNWVRLLLPAIDAAVALTPGTALHPQMRCDGQPIAVPAVFDPSWLARALAIDEKSACAALRFAHGFARWPDHRAEAEQLLAADGCARRGRSHFHKVAHAEFVDEHEQWNLASCCDCGHPFLRLWREDSVAAQSLQWPLFAHLP